MPPDGVLSPVAAGLRPRHGHHDKPLQVDTVAVPIGYLQVVKDGIASWYDSGPGLVKQSNLRATRRCLRPAGSWRLSQRVNGNRSVAERSYSKEAFSSCFPAGL